MVILFVVKKRRTSRIYQSIVYINRLI